MMNNYKISKPVIILGAGGHARVIIDTLFTGGFNNFLGFTNVNNQINDINGIPFLGNDTFLEKQNPSQVLLALGIGSIKANEERKNIFNKWKSFGFKFISIIHSSAIISKNVQIQQGAQILMGSLIQCGAKISENVIINTGAQVDHDCNIQAHVHLAPRSVLSGNVFVGENSHVGTGAIVIQGITIGKLTTIAAGAVVTANIPDFALARGVPARYSNK